MIPRALIQHSLPGRLRLKVPEKKGDGHWLSDTRDALADLEPVTGVQVNPVTAGILIEHRSDSPEALLDRLREQGLFEVPAAGQAADSASEDQEAGGFISEVHVRPHHLAGAAFLALALRQALNGNILGPAINLAYHAFELLSRDADHP